ncbi:MAG: hypothetical protein Q4D97_01965 [Eubacteriales bacterium]|nr:hypothetical protein [Eubacteriales bacterium]
MPHSTSQTEPTAISHSLADYEILVFILPQDKSTPLLDYVRREVHTAASVFLGMGSRPGKLLRLLGLNAIHRDVVMIIQTRDQVARILELAASKLELKKPGHGIAFTIPLQYVHGLPGQTLETFTDNKPFDFNDTAYTALCCILDAGLGEEAVAVAESAGAQGATFLEAKGGGQTSSLLFDFTIEPQKDFLLMILKRNLLDKVADALDHHFTMENENTGIQYSYPLTKVVGLYEQED